MLARNRAFRWILLMMGLVAIIALTGMNLYSLYEIRDRVTEGESSRQIRKAEEITLKVRSELYSPFFSLSRLELEPLEESLNKNGRFPENILSIMKDVSNNPIYTSIYYTPANVDPCVENSNVYMFNSNVSKMTPTQTYSPILCDGVGLVRTKTRIQLNDFDYQWNTIIVFDTHRSMNIGLINLPENRVIGYFTFLINKDYVINELIAPMISEYFDSGEENGTIVWLHDFGKGEVLATNDTSVPFNFDLVDARVRFPRFFDNWNIKIAFLDSQIASAYNATFIKSLIVLGFAVMFLLGALLFMFFTAQRERNLSQRQAGFLANVTHELKTPLAVMQAAGENISDGRVTKPYRLKQYGEHIYQESIRLRKMIDKLLDVAKYDSGHSLIKTAPYQIHFLLAEYIHQTKEFIEEKGFELNFSVEGDIPYSNIDPVSVETIISNLLENAVKYSLEDKKILVRVFMEKKNIVFEVTDHGMGIKKKELKNIFRKFYRVEDSLVARTKGHGLGLSIVRSLVVLNNGTISVKSEYGKGTTFKVSFPTIATQEVAQHSKKSGIISTEHSKVNTSHV
tara:strand:+ start:10562 stop:12262 length:1701 start_codon:yes stop_codon:yes gene_type:complete